MKNEVPEQESLRALLKRMSEHLDGLAEEVQAIEHTIGEQFALAPFQDNQAITRLQRLDFMRQSLEDFALLNLFLSKAHDAKVDPELADRVRLDATKELIRGQKVGASIPPQQGFVGEVDLF